MKGMILAAGFGTRLRPLTWTTPKPLVPLCNRPLIAWAVESYLAAGVDEIVVNVHHLPEPLVEYLDNAFAGRASFRFSHEAEILGTGGGIRRVRPFLESAGEFFLVNGDTVQFPRFEALSAALHEQGAIASLTLRHPPENDRFTPVFFERGRVTGFGRGLGEPLMFAGSHLISSRIFERLPDEEVFGIVDRVYQPLIDGGEESIAGVVDDGLWFDVGTPSRYLQASAGLLAAMQNGAVEVPSGSLLHDTCLVGENAETSGHVTGSTVGARSSVTGTVTDSIVWEDCTIGPEVRLERCVVGSGVALRGRLALSDAVICVEDPSIPQTEGERRDGLVIVGF